MRTRYPDILQHLLPAAFSACLALAPLPAAAIERTLPAPLIEIYGGASTIDAIARDPQGNLCIAGSYSASMSISGVTVAKSGSGTRDLFMGIYRPDGTQIRLLTASSTTASIVAPTAVATDDEGNCYVAGTYQGGAVLGLSAPTGLKDGFLLRFNADTNASSMPWVKAIGSASGRIVMPTDIAVDSAMGAVFVSASFSSAVTIPDVGPILAQGARDGLILRSRTTNGGTVWARTIGDGGGGNLPATFNVARLALDRAAQNIYLAVEYSGTLLNLPFTLTSEGTQDTAVLMLPYGNDQLALVQPFFGGGNTVVNAGGLALDNTGMLHFAGSVIGGGLVAPTPVDGLGPETGFIARLATVGFIDRVTALGGPNASVKVRAVGLDPQSRPYLAGMVSGGAITAPAAAALSPTGLRDGLALGFDASGDIAWARHYGGPNSSVQAAGMAVDADRNIYWAGYFGGTLTSPATDPLSGGGSIVLLDGPPRQTLTVAAPANGSVRDGGGDLDCGNACSISYAFGRTVSLTATPAAGYGFAGWGGDCSGTDNPLTLTMDRARSCTAAFATDANPTPSTPAPAQPAAPPAFVTSPVPTTLDAATVGTGSGRVSLASSFANPAGLSFAASSGTNGPLPAWLTFDPATVSFSYDVPLPADLPIQPAADADAGAGRSDAPVNRANTVYPPLFRVAQFPVTLTATGAGQSYASTIRMSFFAPRPPVAVAALSLSLDAVAGNARSTRPALSFDGGQVLFQTAATNIFPAAPNTDSDIIRYDALSGGRDRLSQTAIPGGGVANAAAGASSDPAVSADGRYGAFASDAPGITLTATGGVRQVYRTALAYPRVSLDPSRTPAPDIVSATPGGVPGNAAADRPALSEDGRYVVFESASTNFAAGLDGTRQVWRKDLVTGALDLVSAAARPGNGASGNAAISWDGRFVAFESTSTNLAAASGTQVYLKDMATGAIRLISAAGGNPADAPAGSPVLSARADKVAFVTGAGNLGFANPLGRRQVVVADLGSMRIGLVSASTAGTAAGGDSDQPAISADGRFIAFRSAAGDLVTAGSGGKAQIWVRDTARAVTALVTQTADGAPAGGASWTPALSGDGSTIAFASDARDLVNGNAPAGQAYLAANPLPLPGKPAYWSLPGIGGGQGWVTERWGDRVYVGTLAYDASGRASWMSGFCTLTGTTCAGTLQGWGGGTPFGLAGGADPAATTGPAFTITIDGTGSNAILAVAGGPAQFITVHAIGGTARTGYAGLPQPGWWYEPDAAGSANGYFLAIHTQAGADGAIVQAAYLAILTFDAAGRPVWLAAQAALTPELGFTGTLYQYQGGAPLGATAPAGSPTADAMGQVRLNFAGSDRATISLPNGRTATLRRFRF